uniref:Putative phosphoenolpyruvate synthase n=1 Tax=Magallana gigas TaxID=29159 RepID=K1QPR0_MAGGI
MLFKPTINLGPLLGPQKGVLESVSRCWASAYSFQAVQYRRQNGQPIRVLVGVVIQEMVKSEVSGVLFTNHPVTGSADHMVIDASYGLGEAVVSGKTTPDSITVLRDWSDKVTVQSKQIGAKNLRIMVKEGGGLEEQSVSGEDMCCLSDSQIQQLCQIGIKLEKYFGSPRDIEWALAGDQFYLLQARPITTLEEVTDEDLIHEFDDPLITDQEWLTTGNISEMLPGATTPLTYSLFASAIDLSCLPNESGSMNNIFGKKENMELTVVGETLADLTEDSVTPATNKKCDDWAKKADSYEVIDQSSDCLQMYRDISKNLPDYTEVWKVGVLKSANSGAWAAAMFGVLLQGKTEYSNEMCSDVAVILSQCQDVYSADVPVAIQGLARSIVASGLEDKFLSGDDQVCVELLSDNSVPAVTDLYKDFMKRHGHRYIREAELMEKSWQTNPERLVQVLMKIIKMKAYQERQKTSFSIKDTIANLKTPLTNGEKRSLKFILPRARRAVGEREFGKSLCVKVADKFKQAYWRLAEKMEQEGRLPGKELLFFLTHREIGQLLETRSPKLLTKAKRRRKLLPKLMTLSFPKYSVGVPKPKEQESFEEQRKPTFTLTGMPICKGRVTGKARVVKTLEEANSIQRDDILIVSYTDVGWTPYFPLLGGLVTEMGGLVSHGAVVAREFQLPCVVNLPLFNHVDVCRFGLTFKSGCVKQLILAMKPSSPK